MDSTPAEPYCHEATAAQIFSEVLPWELTKAILCALNIGALVAFLRANKKTLALSHKYDLWRDYYATYFDCVPQEVLEAMSLKYGHKLLEADSVQHGHAMSENDSVEAMSPKHDHALLGKNSVSEVCPNSVWRQVFKTMKEIYAYDPKHFPQRDDVSPLLQLAARSFPQLHVNYPSCSVSVDGFVWFTAPGSVHEDSSVIHKLGIQYRDRIGYNAILLRKWEYEDHLFSVKQFEELRYIFEWVHAKTANEFVAKIKPLCEIFLLLRYNSSYTCNQKVIPQGTEQQYFSNLRTKTDEIHAEIEKKAEQLSSTMSATEDFQHIETAILKIKESVPIDLDVNLHAQRLPKRSELNAEKKYLQHGMTYDLHTGEWEPHDTTQLPQTIGSGSDQQISKKKRESKSLPKVLVLRLIRVMLNYITMPLLRAFWPQKVSDPDFNCCNFVNRHFKEPYRQYFTPYIALDEISVGHSSPQHWPTIAVAVARLTLSDTCHVAADIIQRRSARDSTEQLLGVLKTIGFHSKSALDELKIRILSWQQV